MKSPKSFSRSMLWLMVILQLAVLVPYRFTDEFGERDSYRMFLGLMDTLKTGGWFDSSLLYNRDASFGYYGLLYGVAKVIGNEPSTLIKAMNWIGLLSVVSFVVPAFLVAERLFGTWIAIVSGILLMATPVWWHCGLYAHPVTTALLLFFSGLAVLCCTRYPEKWTVRGTGLALFTLALMFRFDLVLLFPALIAVLWEIRRSRWRCISKEAVIYIPGSLVVFALIRHFLPPVTQGTAPPSILQLLARFETFTHLLESVRESVIFIGQDFTPILLLPIPISMWILLRRKHYPGLLFVSAEILINLVFWLPNSVPPRHYLLMAPSVSISAALVLMSYFDSDRVNSVTSLRAMIIGASTAVAVVVISLGLNYGTGYLGYFPSQFTERLSMKGKINQANQVANGLVHLPPLNTPAVVLCDSSLVIAEMDKRAKDTSAVYRFAHAGSSSVGVHVVDEGNNRFIMVEQSWEPAEVQAFDRSADYAGLPVLSAPFLPIEYHGPRHLLTLQRFVPAPRR